MKKLLFLLLLIPFNVFAINYSPYSEYKYTDTYVKENENCQVEELKKYKFYKLEKDYTNNYFNSTYKDDYYIYQDSEYIYSDLITSDIKPNTNEVTDLQEKQYTYYQEYNKLRYLILNNFDYSNSLSIKEIYIYDKKNKIINFEVIKGPSNINDNNPSTYTKVDKEDTIIIKLEKEMELKNFRIEIYVAGQYLKTFSLDYNLNYTGDINDIYYYGNIYGGLSSEERYHINIDNTNYKENLNSEIKVKEGYFENIDNAKIVKYETIYTYKEKLYKYYNYKKIYLDDYYFEKEGYIKDLDDYKITYRYRCRTILNNVVSDDKIGFKSKEEYLDFKNKREEVKNKITINKTEEPLPVKVIDKDVDISKYSDYSTNICTVDIKDKDIEIDKIENNSNKLVKLIIIFFGLMIIFII